MPFLFNGDFTNPCMDPFQPNWWGKYKTSKEYLPAFRPTTVGIIKHLHWLETDSSSLLITSSRLWQLANMILLYNFSHQQSGVKILKLNTADVKCVSTNSRHTELYPGTAALCNVTQFRYITIHCLPITLSPVLNSFTNPANAGRRRHFGSTDFWTVLAALCCRTHAFFG